MGVKLRKYCLIRFLLMILKGSFWGQLDNLVLRIANEIYKNLCFIGIMVTEPITEGDPIFRGQRSNSFYSQYLSTYA